MIGTEWKALTQTEKLVFEDKSRADRERYLEEV